MSVLSVQMENAIINHLAHVGVSADLKIITAAAQFAC